MSCKFSVTINDTPQNILSKARAAIQSQNGVLTGNENEGSFEVNVLGNFIKGSYQIQGSQMHLEITDKPFFVPCSMIENMLQKQLT